MKPIRREPKIVERMLTRSDTLLTSLHGAGDPPFFFFVLFYISSIGLKSLLSLGPCLGHAANPRTRVPLLCSLPRSGR